jgi:SAM-dependent methyltransferase
MPDELTTFQTAGPSWEERARVGELNAVLSPTGTAQRNHFIHGVHIVGARQMVRLVPRGGTIVDFGCGTGRFVRYFGAKGFRVVGTEITPAMLGEAERFGLPEGAEIVCTDGVHIPLPKSSVDGIWCCAVLRYAALVDEPVIRDIADEMFRVLRPGGVLCNLEMYVDVPPERFTEAMVEAGFTLRGVKILERHGGLPERCGSSILVPPKVSYMLGLLTGTSRALLDRRLNDSTGYQDYFMVLAKP